MHTKRFEKYRRWIGIFLHNNIVQENACFYGNLEHPKDFLDYLSNRSWYSCLKAAGVISTFTHETLLINFDTLCTESCCQLCLDPRKWLSHTRLCFLSTFDTLCPSDSLIPPFRLAPYLDKSPKIVFLWRRRFCTEPCCQLCWNAFVCIQAEFWRACICRMQPWWLPWEVGEHCS